MSDTETSLLALTAGHLMSREVMTLAADLPLRDAAQELARLGVHGAPVVDAAGKCVGVLSVADFARWVARPTDPHPPPQACAYQEVLREPGGQETVRCLLHPGACSLQRFQERAGGRLALVCVDPHGVCTDWQVVEVANLPTDSVSQVMTTDVVTAKASTSVAELARQMLDRAVRRVIVTDPDGRPIGVVSASDLLRAIAQEGGQ